MVEVLVEALFWSKQVMNLSNRNAIFLFGDLKRFQVLRSIIWSNAKGINGIGVRMDIPFRTKYTECTAGTNLVLGMLLGLLVRRSTSRIRLKKGNSTPTAPATLPSPVAAIKPNTGDLSKLSLLKSLQSALMTKAGISEDQFKKIWDEACSFSGN